MTQQKVPQPGDRDRPIVVHRSRRLSLFVRAALFSGGSMRNVSEWSPADSCRQLIAESGRPCAGQLKGVLFDIDGTLTDSDHLHFEV